MYEKAKQFSLGRPTLRKVVGVFVLTAGIIALVTPLTPGAIILLAIGLELLGFSFLLERFRPSVSKEGPSSPTH